MNDAITIRAACLADTAFLVDCNAAMALETEHKLLDREVLKQGTEAVFADAQRGFYRIAERAGVAVGCLLVTHEWSDWRNGDWWWIQSVYVTAEARRGGSVMLRLPGPAAPVVTLLRGMGISTDGRGNILRASPGVVTTDAGVEALVEGLARHARQ